MIESSFRLIGKEEEVEREKKEKGLSSHQKAAHDREGMRSQCDRGNVSRKDLNDLETQQDHRSTNE